MRCTHCQSTETKVTNIEQRQNGSRVYRRHFCRACSKSFNSVQLPETQARKLNKALLALDAIASEKPLPVAS